MSTSGEKRAEAHVAWRRLLTAHASAVRVIAEGLDGAGVLSMERYDLLLALWESPGGQCRLTELADALLFTRGGITRLVAKLAREGLVSVRGSAEDARVKHASLTAKGRRALAATWKVYGPLIERHFADHLDTEQVRSLSDVLGTLLARHDRATRVPLTVAGKSPRRGAGG